MLKPAEDRDGLVLRLTNPAATPREAWVHAPEGALLTPVRLDERPTGDPVVRQGPAAGAWPPAPFATLTLRVN